MKLIPRTEDHRIIERTGIMLLIIMSMDGTTRTIVALLLPWHGKIELERCKLQYLGCFREQWREPKIEFYNLVWANCLEVGQVESGPKPTFPFTLSKATWKLHKKGLVSVNPVIINSHFCINTSPTMTGISSCLAIPRQYWPGTPVPCHKYWLGPMVRSPAPSKV